LRQQRDRDALRAGLADGTIDALVSDHTPVTKMPRRCRSLKRSRCTGVETALSLALKWSMTAVSLWRAPWAWYQRPGRCAGVSLGKRQGRVGRLVVGGVADLCVFDRRLPGRCSPPPCEPGQTHAVLGLRAASRVRYTLIGGQVAYESGARTQP